MPHVSDTPLRAFIKALFEAADAPPEEVEIVAGHMIDANLMGHDSHGVMLASAYLDAIANGGILPGRGLRIIERRNNILRMDAQGGFGQVAAAQATDAVCDLARELGAAMGVLRRTLHVGRVGAYAERAVGAGCIIWLACSSPCRPYCVAPHGGIDRKLYPDPIAFGAPVADGPPLVLDMTTSVVAQGKLLHASARGVPVPLGWIQDYDGRPATDPALYWDAERPGSMLPLGGAAGHKGFGLSLLAEILVSLLMDAGAAEDAHGGDGDALWSGSNDLWIGAWSLEHHGGAERLEREVEVFASHVKSARPGDPNRPVLLPGEAEIRSREHRLAEGIPIEDATWAALAEKAKALGVPLPETMAGSVSSDATGAASA
jgi:uncharacterized oxidoreductase